MIEKILTKIKDSSALEVQFRLGHKTIAKIKNEWIEIDQNSLGVSEWEDLKDLCLNNSDKLALETKGHTRGVFKTIDQSWSFSFAEYKDCLKAFFSVIPNFQVLTYIQSPLFWESVKKKSGLFIITGEKGQGKSLLTRDIISEMTKDSPKLVAIHGQFSTLSMLNSDSVMHLSEETLQWDCGHPLYDGVDQLVVDFNSVKNWEKWIRFCEEGRSVYITLSGLSIENCIEQIQTQLVNQDHLLNRFFKVLNGMCFQKVIGVKEGAVHEFIIVHDSFRDELGVKKFKFLINEKQNIDSFKSYYQSLNQSIIQSLIRRRIDVKTAFSISNNPDELDQQLKRMGL